MDDIGLFFRLRAQDGDSAQGEFALVGQDSAKLVVEVGDALLAASGKPLTVDLMRQRVGLLVDAPQGFGDRVEGVREPMAKTQSSDWGIGLTEASGGSMRSAASSAQAMRSRSDSNATHTSSPLRALGYGHHHVAATWRQQG